MAIEPGTHLGPYRILERLDSGGMGTVYRARDDRLKRDVAVKVLRGTDSGNPERHARLLWEAPAASALSHSSIAAVFGIGTDAGMPYVVSELVDRQTLRHEVDRRARNKPPALHCDPDRQGWRWRTRRESLTAISPRT